MIYEVILYQGMTIDLNTQRKHTEIHEHMQLLIQMTIHINQSQFLYILIYADPSYLPAVHFNKDQNVQAHSLIWI